MSRRIWFWLLFVLMLIADQVVKHWARTAAEGYEGRTFWPVWPGVFEFTLTYNQGVAFGMFQGYGHLLAPIAIVIAGGAAYYSWKHTHEPMAVHIGLALVATGAIGNLIDRLWMQKVTDMLHVTAINFPVFNVADVCITVGAGLLIIAWSIEGARAARHENAAAVPPATAATEDSPAGH
jgi:signal peptidase II